MQPTPATNDKIIVYTDMCADLFHYGHVRLLRGSKERFPGCTLVVGIHSDQTIETYKRRPILTMEERIEVVAACRYVDRVIPDAPIVITSEFLDTHGIDHVTYAGNATVQENHRVPLERGIFTKLPYTHTISTTDIIQRCKVSP